jgi:uncharacterized RDD family membrane protein YckC
MADDLKKKSTESSADMMSPLERYLAKQKQEKAAQAAKELPVPKSRLTLGKAGQKASPSAVHDSKASSKASTDDFGNVRPSLSNIQRPPSNEPAQPPSLGRWESVADGRLSETDRRAQEAGAPLAPPARLEAPVDEHQPPHVDRVQPITDVRLRPDGLLNAEFGPRFIAWFIDTLILLPLSWMATKVVLALVSVIAAPVVALHGDGFGYLSWLIAIYAYYGYFYSAKGASPGKLMLGLEVVDTDGVTRLSMWKAFFREAIGKPISAIPFCMGYLIIIIRADHRALHDLLFDTRVIKRTGITQ